MADLGDTFFTSIGCMDGRVQAPIAAFGKNKFNAQYPDTITEAGLVGKLSETKPEQDLIGSIKFKSVDVSVGMHHSKGIVVHGHQLCAGNPVDDELHKEQIKKSVDFVKRLVDESVQVLPVFVTKQQHGWVVEEL